MSIDITDPFDGGTYLMVDWLVRETANSFEQDHNFTSPCNGNLKWLSIYPVQRLTRYCLGGGGEGVVGYVSFWVSYK